MCRWLHCENDRFDDNTIKKQPFLGSRSQVSYARRLNSFQHYFIFVLIGFFLLFRMHHKFTDSDADPHNSSRGLFFSHMGWLLVRKHPEIKRKGATIDMSDLENDPIVMFQKK